MLTRVVEEERVVGPSILDQPVHGTKNVLLCGLAHGVLLVVGENDHILPLIAKLLHQVGRHVPDIVDAPSQLATLAKVVDANEQRFSSARAVGVSKRVTLRCALAKALRPVRRGRGVAVGTPLVVATRGRHAFYAKSAQ